MIMDGFFIIGFMGGIDLTGLVILLIVLLIFAELIYWLIRKALSHFMKDWSDRTIKILSRVSAVILSPVLIVGLSTLVMYWLVPRQSEEEQISEHYQLMEEEIAETLKIGMSKREVVASFGEVDTTESVLLYDLSVPEAKERYILEIKFNSRGLSNFRRRQ